jgi:hypothetical protein
VSLGLPAGTYVCQTAAWFTLSCASSTVTRTNYTGYCVEAAPSMKQSQLSDNDASFIQVGVWGCSNDAYFPHVPPETCLLCCTR